MATHEIIFQELLTYCQMKAIGEKFAPTEESIWKALTRSYSERWGVPLPQVRKMDPEEVISEIFEAKYEEMDAFEEVEELLDLIYTTESPLYEKQQKADMDVFIKNVGKREKKRIDAEREKLALQQNALRQQQPVKKGGSVDFSKLKNEG
jgi:hypothetical protein